MTILPISNKGSITLPGNVLSKWKDAEFLQLKISANSVSLTPVQITPMKLNEHAKKPPIKTQKQPE